MEPARPRLQVDGTLDPHGGIVAGCAMRKHSVLIICGLAVALPTVAFAGSKATSGDQTLQLSESVTPNKASTKTKARGVVVKIHVDYESLNANSQVAETTKQVLLTAP